MRQEKHEPEIRDEIELPAGISMSPEELAKFKEFKAPYDKLYRRGHVAIANFLLFLVIPFFLIPLAVVLERLKTALPQGFTHFGNPIETVMSLSETRPITALLALTLLVRGMFFLVSPKIIYLFADDIFEAFYAVAFSIYGFAVGAGIVQIAIQHSFSLFLVSIFATLFAFAVFVAIDLAWIKYTARAYPIALRMLIFALCATAAIATLYSQ
jgi:hypothetical protein